MSSFTTSLRIEDIDGTNFELIEEFVYFITWGLPDKVVVPAGFITDFATVPAMFRFLVPATGRHGKACVVHDYLCRTPIITTDKTTYRISRKEADEIFYEAMKVLNVPAWRRVLMYAFVRAYAIITGKK